jgi:CBS domain-containing protein
MTPRQNLHVVKPSTSVDDALELLVEKKVTGLPVIDDNWTLVKLRNYIFCHCVPLFRVLNNKLVIKLSHE